MKREYAFYCRLCWQQFDHPHDHDAGSFYKGERLNGHCPGDIQRADWTTAKRPRPEPGPILPDPGEPLVIS